MVRFTRAGVALTVGIILLTGLIVGGLFWVKEQGEQARRDEAIKIAEENLIDGSANDGVALNEGDDAAKPEEADDTPTSEEATGSESTNGTSNESDQGQNGSTVSPSPSELPETGPAEQFMSIVALAGLTYSVALYVESQRGAKYTK